MNHTIKVSQNGEITRPNGLTLLNVAGVVAEVHQFTADVRSYRHVTQGRIELGAEITLYDAKWTEVVDLWAWLRVAFGLTCAWLESEPYSGCILNHPEYPIHEDK